MKDFKRRDFLKATAGVAAGTALGTGSLLSAGEAVAQTYKAAPEKGAKLRVLRWKRFVQGDEDVWAANTKKFTADDRHRGARRRRRLGRRAAEGCGRRQRRQRARHHHQHHGRRAPVSRRSSSTSSDLANYLGNKYGGWYEAAKAYGMHDKKWVAIMMGAAGATLVYRGSQLKAAGFETFPKDMAGFLKLCQALKAKGTPPGFALGNATGDSNWTFWLVWAHGGKMVDAKNNVVINSPETIAALEYSKQLYETFIPGTLSWLDPNNNKAFLDSQISLTNNGISIYYAAKTSQDPKLLEMANDIQHAAFPLGIDGKSRELNLVFPMMIFKYSKYPNAAKEYLRFMMEREQYVPWQEASIGYVCHPLAAYESSPFWTADPKKTPYRDCMKNMTPNGYAGTLGYASAAAQADFIIPNMVAEAASGSKTPKEAAERAQKRAERYYKV